MRFRKGNMFYRLEIVAKIAKIADVDDENVESAVFGSNVDISVQLHLDGDSEF